LKSFSQRHHAISNTITSKITVIGYCSNTNYINTDYRPINANTLEFQRSPKIKFWCGEAGDSAIKNAAVSQLFFVCNKTLEPYYGVHLDFDTKYQKEVNNCLLLLFTQFQAHHSHLLGKPHHFCIFVVFKLEIIAGHNKRFYMSFIFRNTQGKKTRQEPSYLHRYKRMCIEIHF